MSANEGGELRHALKALQDARQVGDAHRAETALERSLLTTPAAELGADTETVASAVRLLRGADDGGTTRLEVRDQAMTRRRWFEVKDNGETTWGDR
ncbi:MAG: hypothetical protein ACXVSL_08600 [Solirubrobacteraceae bacterium]